MPNIAEVLKSEIARISRKELRIAVSKLVDKNKLMKKAMADLTGRVAQLERENKRLLALEIKFQKQQLKTLLVN